MAKVLLDLTWLNGRGQSIATVGVSAALTEVSAFRQDGFLERAQPGDDIIVLMVDKYRIYTAASAAAMFST